MKKDRNGNPLAKRGDALTTRGSQSDSVPAGVAPSRGDLINRFQKRRIKIGDAKAALEIGLTIEEVCSILNEENQGAMRIAVEAWDKLVQVRQALIAMRGNLNSAELEQIIKDIGNAVNPFQGVDLFDGERKERS
jgi:hypothetical protein